MYVWIDQTDVHATWRKRNGRRRKPHRRPQAGEVMTADRRPDEGSGCWLRVWMSGVRGTRSDLRMGRTRHLANHYMDWRELGKDAKQTGPTHRGGSGGGRNTMTGAEMIVRERRDRQTSSKVGLRLTMTSHTRQVKPAAAIAYANPFQSIKAIISYLGRACGNDVWP